MESTAASESSPEAILPFLYDEAASANTGAGGQGIISIIVIVIAGIISVVATVLALNPLALLFSSLLEYWN